MFRTPNIIFEATPPNEAEPNTRTHLATRAFRLTTLVARINSYTH
jgi:hypothetical protein